MVEKINQIVIEKVENGFIIALQSKGSDGFFKGNCLSDKKFFVAKDKKDIVTILNDNVDNMESGFQSSNVDLNEEEQEDESY